MANDSAAKVRASWHMLDFLTDPQGLYTRWGQKQDYNGDIESDLPQNVLTCLHLQGLSAALSGLV